MKRIIGLLSSAARSLRRRHTWVRGALRRSVFTSSAVACRS
jgi:hypothetical protein